MPCASSSETGGTIEIDRDAFERLRIQINQLQAVAANHLGVLAARQKWFDLLLRDFETKVVIPAEEGGFPDYLNYPMAPQGDMLGVTDDIEHFLRRSYLSSAFGAFFSSTVKLYERMAQVQKIDSEVKHRFKVQADVLNDDLLRGRF